MKHVKPVSRMKPAIALGGNIFGIFEKLPTSFANLTNQILSAFAQFWSSIMTPVS